MLPYRILLLVSFLASALPLKAQDLNSTVSGNFTKGESLNKVLKNFQKTTNLKFAFDEKRLEEVKVSGNYTKVPIKIFLSEQLKNHSLGYLLLDNTIIIKPIEDIPDFEYASVTKKKYSISGIIQDSLTGERLPYAAVVFDKTQQAGATNISGFFVINNIESDTGWIVINYLGYQKKKVGVNLEKDQFIQVALVPNNFFLNEVLIEGDLNNLIERSEKVSEVTINPAQMQNLPNLGEVDVFRSIQLLPGINGTFETASNINIRGSSPDQNLILLDGFNIYHLDHFFGIFSAFNNNAIKNIKLSKGGFEAKYGGRVGGVLDITGKTGNTKKAVTGFGFNFIGLNALVEVPIKDKTTVFFAARRSLTDVYPTRSFKELIENVLNNDINTTAGSRYKSYDELDPLFNFYDLNGKISHKFTKSDILTLSVYHGRDFLKLDNSENFTDFEFQTENRTQWGNLGLGLTYNKQWEKNLYSDFSLGFSNYFSRVTYGSSRRFVNEESEDRERIIFFEQDNDVNDISLRIDNGWNYADNQKLEFGTWITNNVISYTVLDDTTFTEDIALTGNQSAIYVQNVTSFSNKGQIIPGLRYNYYDITKSNFIEPRLNVNYFLTDKLMVKGAYGRFNQVVSRVLRRDIFASNPDFWIIADNKDIPVLSADHYIAGMTYHFTKELSFDVEAYQKYSNGVLEYIPPEGIFANSDTNYTPYFKGRGSSRGIEFTLQKKSKNYSGWISYGLSYNVNQFEELNDNEKYPSNQDQRHEVKFVNIFTFKKFDFSAVWIYGSGRPYTSPLGNFNVQSPDGSDLELLYVSDINSFRLPDYHRLDISVNYTFKFGKAEGQIGLSIFNAYDRNNIKYRRFVRIEEEANSSVIGNTRYLSSDVNLLGFTPNINFEIRF